MSAEALRKRRIAQLKKLAAKAAGRDDVKIPLSEVPPTLDLGVYAFRRASRYRFLDKDNPKPERGSDLPYELNTLMEGGYIEPTHMHYGQDACGGVVPNIPAIKMTPAGFDALAEFQKSWIKQGTEKQPITFLQIIITSGVGMGGWLVGSSGEVGEGVMVHPAETR